MTQDHLRPHNAVDALYHNDLKSILEFDRKCRALEVVYQDLSDRIKKVEKDMAEYFINSNS